MSLGDEKEQMTDNQAAGTPAGLQQIRGTLYDQVGEEGVMNGGSIKEREKT